MTEHRRIIVLLPKDLIEQLEDIAEEDHTTVSTIVEAAVRNYTHNRRLP